MAAMQPAMSAASAPTLNDDAARALLAHSNRLRASAGLAPLRAEPRLTSAARRFAEYMAATDRYGHEADGRQPAQRAQGQGYAYCLVAENIAFAVSDAGFDADGLAEALFDGWVTSPAHRHNLLDGELTEVGIASAHSEHSDRHYAVQLFGRPRSLVMRFELRNATAGRVTYQLGGRNYELAAGTVRTHEQCRQASLSLPGAQRPIAVQAGARYRVEASSAGLLLQAD